MLRFYWLIIVAFGLVAFSSNAQEHLPNEQTGVSQSQAVVEQPALVFVLPTEPNSRDNSNSQEAQNYLIFGDGLAQWLIVAVSGAALVVSIWAVCLLKKTLNATHAAVQSTNCAVDVTRKIGQAQTRAYLTVRNFDTDISNTAIKITTTFKNSGQTPARDVKFHIQWASETTAFEEKWHPAHAITAAGRGSIGSGLPFHGHCDTSTKQEDPDKSLTEEQILEVLDGKRNFWVFGVIEYVDVFETPRTTRFRYLMNRRRNEVGFSPCNSGNDET